MHSTCICYKIKIHNYGLLSQKYYIVEDFEVNWKNWTLSSIKSQKEIEGQFELLFWGVILRWLF